MEIKVPELPREGAVDFILRNALLPDGTRADVGPEQTGKVIIEQVEKIIGDIRAAVDKHGVSNRGPFQFWAMLDALLLTAAAVLKVPIEDGKKPDKKEVERRLASAVQHLTGFVRSDPTLYSSPERIDSAQASRIQAQVDAFTREASPTKST